MPDGVISVALSVGEENDLSVAIVQAPRGTADEEETIDSEEGGETEEPARIKILRIAKLRMETDAVKALRNFRDEMIPDQPIKLIVGLGNPAHNMKE